MHKIDEINVDKRKVYIFVAVLLAALVSLLFIPKDISRAVTAVLLVLSAVTVLLILKKRKVPSINRRAIALLLFAIAGFFLALYYISGVFFGYVINPYASSFGKSLLYVLCVAVSVIAMEIIRNVVFAAEDRIASVVVTVCGIVADVLISTRVLSVVSFNNFMDLVGLTVFPAVTASVLYNYSTKNYGVLPGMLYKLLLTLYIYAIPVLPNVPDSLFAFFRLVTPLIAYLFVDMLYGKKKKRATRAKKGIGALALVITSFLMISVVMLISCKFRYGLIVIATESMTGEINKGDAVVYESYDGDVILDGEVIVYRKDESLVVHRVVGIERINGQTRYYTKGDANEENDRGYITDADVVGRVSFKLSGIGYPTLWLREIFN